LKISSSLQFILTVTVEPKTANVSVSSKLPLDLHKSTIEAGQFRAMVEFEQELTLVAELAGYESIQKKITIFKKNNFIEHLKMVPENNFLKFQSG